MIVITTTIDREKRYLRFKQLNAKNVYVAEYERNYEDATNFSSEQEAIELIPRIYNFLDREFSVETIQKLQHAV